jgi:aryl-alcohol dehydrogenase-like predicted oxidoreductase
MAFSGQAAGFFHKVLAGEDPVKAGEYYNTPENLRRAGALKKLSEETGLSLSSLLLKYLLQAQTLQIIPLIRGIDREQLELVLETLDDTEVDFGDLRDFE